LFSNVADHRQFGCPTAEERLGQRPPGSQAALIVYESGGLSLEGPTIVYISNRYYKYKITYCYLYLNIGQQSRDLRLARGQPNSRKIVVQQDGRHVGSDAGRNVVAIASVHLAQGSPAVHDYCGANAPCYSYVATAGCDLAKARSAGGCST
jgi:hypothetical protein